MNVIPTELPGVLIIEPRVFGDARGFFLESWNEQAFAERGPDDDIRAGQPQPFRRRARCAGCTTSCEHTQGKLVRVTAGEVFDVAVDMRRSSPTFGKWVGVTLSGENKRMLWVPQGFAHGFYVTSARGRVPVQVHGLLRSVVRAHARVG